MKTLLSAFALACSSFAAVAQTAEPKFTMSCDEGRHSYSYNGSRNEQYCETRDLTMNAPANGKPLSIDGGANGGVAVHGWAGSTVRIRVKITSWANSAAEAQALVKAVAIGTANDQLQADVLGRDKGYSVSYEVFVPRQTALAVNTLNGGISLNNLQSDVKFQATNGSVSLANLGGQVTGRTVNGGLSIVLSGSKWDGKGLDVETTNGGISWMLPDNYSAQLFTSTDMGSIRTELPVTKTGFMHKEVVASLGKGGAPVKAVTTNGGIHVRRLGNLRKL